MVKTKHGRKKVHTAKWERCVKAVGKKQKRVNPYAVCTKALGKKAFLKKKKTAKKLY